MRKFFVFLDRDGVINKKLENDYVKKIDEFEFLPNAIEAVKNLNDIFDRTIIVTNQRGIGRGLMSEEDLNLVHRFMLNELQKRGAKIDAIYFCPHDNEVQFCECRKPNIGMALKAKSDFPEIDFSKSFMVGDSISDMEFGRNAGMLKIYIGKSDKNLSRELYDNQFKSLYDFSMWAKNELKNFK